MRVLCLLVGLGWAGTSVATAQDAPFAGIVIEDGAKARADTGRVYYVVGELKQGTVVQVEEVIYGWNKIQPPQGIHSYISRMLVDAHGDGTTGTVNTDGAEVKAASVKGPGESYHVQLKLNRGTKVQIVGEDGSYYKILPPAGASVFLPPGSVHRVSAADLAALASESDTAPAPAPTPDPAAAPTSPAEQPVSPPQTQPQPQTPIAPEPVTEAQAPPAEAPSVPVEPTQATAAAEVDVPATQPETAAAAPVAAATQPAATQPATQPATDLASADAPKVEAAPGAIPGGPGAEEVETPAVSEALRAVELRNLPLFALPLEKQPMAAMIAEYEAVLADASLPYVDQRIVRYRLAALRRNQELAAVLTRIDSARQAVQQSEAATPAEAPVVLPVRYDVVGRLMTSSVYDGQTLPRLYRVVDPASSRTLGYVQPDAPVEPQQMLGQIVGIVGQPAFNTALNREVLEVAQIDVLSPTEASE